MAFLKQSTAYTRMFFMVSSTDHLSAKTGLTCTVNISKAGAAFGAAAGTVTEIANGWYKVAYTTADTGTTGDLAAHVTATGADDTDFVDQVVAIDVMDATAFGLSRLDAAVSSRMATFTLPTNFSSFSVDASGRVDVAKVGGTAQTARDLGASVLISSGTGTGQLDVTSGVIKANLAQILGTALTETAGQIAAAFKQFFNIASPTSTMNTITAVTTAVSLTTNNDKTGYRLSATGVQDVWDEATASATTAGSMGKLLTDNVNATIGSRSTYAGGAVASVTGDVGGNVVGSVGSVTGTVNADVKKINGTTVNGNGAGTPWGP